MARKVKGYVELYWTCPRCGNENAGAHAYCMSCGGPQPADVDFHQRPGSQLLTDAEQIRRAKAGADIHCGFCGTRNPAGATACSQCHAELSQGTQRGSGKVLGAFTASRGAVAPIACPSCGTMNAGTRTACGNCGAPLAAAAPKATATKAVAAKPLSPMVWVIGAGVILGLCSIFYFLFLRTSNVSATVVGATWHRSIVVEAFGPVRAEDWYNDLPFDAESVSCQAEVRDQVSSRPIGQDYREVCGTEYVVDTGSGAGEVVQDCYYEVYDDYCSYTVDAWAPAGTVELEGSGLAARWPSPALSSEQRLGEGEESYTCLFESGGDSYTYSTDSFSQYQQCTVGSHWSLQVNTLGGVSSITPAD